MRLIDPILNTNAQHLCSYCCSQINFKNINKEICSKTSQQRDTEIEAQFTRKENVQEMLIYHCFQKRQL